MTAKVMNGRCRKLMSSGVAAVAAAGFIASAQAQQGAAPRPAAAATGAQPRLLGQFGDWGAYTAAPGGRKICFAIAKPRTSRTEPPNRPRDPAYFFVTTRPAENVRNEISVNVGYPQRPNKQAVAEVAGATFNLYTQSDGAWIQNVAEEARLVEAMRRGADLLVKATSARGTDSFDTYSLSGLSQAIDRINNECR